MRFIEDASENISEIKKAAPQRHRTRRALSFPLLRMFLAALTVEKRGLILCGCTHDFNYMHTFFKGMHIIIIYYA